MVLLLFLSLFLLSLLSRFTRPRLTHIRRRQMLVSPPFPESPRVPRVSQQLSFSFRTKRQKSPRNTNKVPIASTRAKLQTCPICPGWSKTPPQSSSHSPPRVGAEPGDGTIHILLGPFPHPWPAKRPHGSPVLGRPAPESVEPVWPEPIVEVFRRPWSSQVMIGHDGADEIGSLSFS